MSFESDFADMLETGVLVAQPGTTDGTGKFTPSGSATTMDGYIEAESEMAFGEGGKQVISSVSVFVGIGTTLNPKTFRFTIPSRYSPYEDLEAEAVDHVNDDDGPYYQEVVL